MKLVLLASLAFLATPALSQNDDANPMVITAASRPTVAVWSQKITQRLNNTLKSSVSWRDWNFPEGTVSVRFSCGDDGKPTSVALFRRSGEREVDSAALRAVSHLNALHPMPSAIGHDVTIQANIIFAADNESLARQQAVLRRNEAQRIAHEAGRGHAVVVIELSSLDKS